jgi:phosphoserine phosphatase RsbU/P
MADREAFEEEVRFLRAAGLEILVPAFAGDRLVGGLVLGPKRSETAYEGTELEVLQIIAGQMAVQLENTRLYREAIERQRLEEELAVARSIQQRLLPGRVPTFTGFDLAAINQPSSQVSGDYFDFVELDGSCGMVIADVSGKGLPASLLASNLQASIRALATRRERPGMILEAVNTSLYESTDPERFATAFLAALEPSGRLVYSNAGHNPPLLRRSDGRIEWLDAGATPLGAFPGMSYEEGEVELAPGDVLVLFTDGVTEAEDATGEFFGEEGLQKTIEECHGSTAEEIVGCIRRAVKQFAHGAQTDDMTLIVVRRAGTSTASTSCAQA